MDAAEAAANDALSSMQAHDWQEAVKGMRLAIDTCGDCSDKADLHKSLGLIYCHAGDLVNGERELRFAASSKNDADIQRALTLIARARSQQSEAGQTR